MYLFLPASAAAFQPSFDTYAAGLGEHSHTYLSIHVSMLQYTSPDSQQLANDAYIDPIVAI
jgi:hypothetical protein